MLNTSTRGPGGAAPARRAFATVAAGAALLLASCDLDLTNPNSPTQEATVSSAEGLVALGVGLQNRAGDATGNFIYGAGLVTDELAAGLAALQGVRDTEIGTVGQGSNVTNDLFDSEYRVIKTANDIILNADNVDISEGTRSGLLAVAYLFKAGAIGELLQSYPEIAIETVGTPTPEYVDRATALAYAIALLDTAAITFNATAPSPQFNTSVRSTGFDVINTIYAFRARLQRIAGDNAAAIASANLVSRTVFSTLSHTPQAVNRVFNLSSTGSSSALPRDAVRLTAPAGYGPVVAYHITPAATSGFLQPVDAFARFTTASSPLPLYYPDEVLLIKAEALARQNTDLAQAQAVLDSVRTDCPGLVATDPNACLPPLVGVLTQAQLLDEIYTVRRYELFATGLRWEDARRLGLVGSTSVAKRCWFPYPIGEKNGNPDNVPADLEGLDAPANNAACRP